MNVEKRFSKGFSVLANYAWAKTMDDFGTTIPLLGREFNRAVASENVPSPENRSATRLAPAAVSRTASTSASSPSCVACRKLP